MLSNKTIVSISSYKREAPSKERKSNWTSKQFRFWGVTWGIRRKEISLGYCPCGLSFYP